MPRSSYKQKSKAASSRTPSVNKGRGELRIIGGQLRGRKLAIADVPGLRPTTDRVRETVFNWLQFELAQQRCLDLFAGSGALAFEALSRGASEVILIEQDSQAARLLAHHAQILSAAVAGQALVQCADTLAFLQQLPSSPFQVVFIDPPFGIGLVDRSIELLEQNNWLAAGSWVYIESERDLTPTVPSHWHLHREKHAGQVTFRLYTVS
ncbi:16S rRNA (guanine(966)-N(2))-methyltransferase RsmD [Pseudidiomarina sp.]|uniref:16S rRNA (guanine(966)-N(2))-methyltransferase RsmD n=1 Tax=Pseudidiomarina sp. TaxID=2081707 RepID=UPI003A982CE6